MSTGRSSWTHCPAPGTRCVPRRSGTRSSMTDGALILRNGSRSPVWPGSSRGPVHPSVRQDIRAPARQSSAFAVVILPAAMNEASSEPSPPSRARGLATALAGPLLIVLALLVVLHKFFIGRLVPIQYGTDILAYWIPNLCFLGKSLAAGHIPAWNPHVMGGLPFAADPHTGWLNLPAMALFTALPCQLALRWHIVLQPILAGLGLYWFLRSEQTSRPAATVGGLAIALPIASSSLVLSLGLTTSLAWTTLLLAAASRFMRVSSWPGRMVWAALTALAWGQLAAAHAQWLIVGTVGVAIYVVARTVADVRSRRSELHQVLGVAALLVVAVPLVNLAYLAPRVAYLGRSTLGLGYEQLGELSQRLTGHGGLGFEVAIRLNATWPLRLTQSPGLYLGALALGFSFAWWGSKRHRVLGSAFAAYGALSFALSLQSTGRLLGKLLGSSTIASSYVHAPYRFASGLLIAMSVLAGLGIDGWKARRPWSGRAGMIAPALVVWAVVPPILGVHPRHTMLFVAGAAATALLLFLAKTRPSLLVLAPALLALELVVNGLVGQGYPPPSSSSAAVGPLLPPRRQPIDLGAYVRPGPIAAALRSDPVGRYISLDPRTWSPTGYHLRWGPRYWGLMATDRSAIFGLEEAQGYNSDQLLRYWEFVRALEPKLVRYAAGYFVDPPLLALDLLGVRWVVGSADSPPIGNAIPIALEGRWALYRVPATVPRASVLTSWRVVRSSDQALAAIRDPAFDSRRVVILERDSGLAHSGAASGDGRASYRALGAQAAEVDVVTPMAAVVLVRNVYDPGWHATVDGHAAPVIAADYLVQGVPVPAGRHTIRLEYDDPWVGRGLLGSGAALTLLMGAALLLQRRARPLATRGEPGRMGGRTSASAGANSPVRPFP
jgi:hypothetical protein